MVTKSPAKVAEAVAASPSDVLFADLFATETVEEKRATVNRSAISVPQEWIDRVEKAYAESQRVTLKVSDKSVYDNVANLLRAAGDKSDKSITVTCKAVFDGEGDDAKLTGLSFTVGNRRGQKPGKNVSDAPAAK